MTLDSSGRRLTAEEQRARDRLLPALEAWTAYLSANGAHDRFDDAEAARKPIKIRHRCSFEADTGHQCPMALSPLYALTWARGHGLGGQAGTGTLLTLSDMISALDFMNARRAVTFRPMVDERGARRRDGYWRLSGEMVARLRGRAYVPVLTPLPGPRRKDRVMPVPRFSRSDIRTIDSRDMTLSLVRHFLQTTPVTALLSTATSEGRPLATRPPGRTPSAMANGAVVRTSHVVFSVDALTVHAQRYADHLGIAVPGRGEVAAALAGQHAVNPGLLAPVAQFSTVDAGQQRKARDWWRVALDGLTLGKVVDRAELMGEVEHWRRTVERREPATEREPVSSVTWDLPDGLTLADLSPEDRDLYGIPEDA